MFARPRPKYIQHVKALYPNSSQPQGKVQNLSAFLHFAVSNPKYLKDMGTYILHRIQKHIRYADTMKVPIPVAAMCSLIEACDSDLTKVELWQDAIKSAILVLLSENNSEYQIYGTQILLKYAKQSNSDEFQAGRLDAFFDPLVKLINEVHPSPDIQSQVQTACLQSLHQMLLYNDERNSTDHLKTVVPAILSNITSFPESWESYEDQKHDNNPNHLSLKCLIEISHILDISSIAQALKPVFEFLDQQNWRPRQNASACIRLIADNSRKLLNGYNLTYEILRHLDSCRKSGRSKLSEEILLTMADVVIKMRLPIGPWEGLLRLLFQILNSAISDQDSLTIHESFVKIIAAYSLRMPSAVDQLKLIDTITKLVSHKDASAKVKEVYLQCAYTVALLRKKYLLDFNSTFARTNYIRSLLSVSEKFKDNRSSKSINSWILKILCAILVHNPLMSDSKFLDGVDGSLERDPVAKELGSCKSKVEDFINSILKGTLNPTELGSSAGASSGYASAAALITSENGKLLRHFVYQDIIINENAVSCDHYHLITLMLFLKPVEEMNESFPMMLHLLELSSSKEKSRIDVYALVLAYFLFVVQFFATLGQTQSQWSGEYSSTLQSACVQLDKLVSFHAKELNKLKSGISVNIDEGGLRFRRVSFTSSLSEKSDLKMPEPRLSSGEVLSILSQIQFSSDISESKLEEKLLKGFQVPNSGWFHDALTEKENPEEVEDPGSVNSVEEDEIPFSSIDSTYQPRSTVLEFKADHGTTCLKSANFDDYHSIIKALTSDKDKQDALVSRALHGTSRSDDRDILQMYEKDSSDEDEGVLYEEDGDQETETPGMFSVDFKQELDEMEKDDYDINRTIRKKKIAQHRSILNLPDEPSTLLKSQLPSTFGSKMGN